MLCDVNLWSEMKKSRLGLLYPHSTINTLLLPSIFDQTKTKTKTKMATLYLALDILKKLIFNPQGKSYRAEDKRNKLKRKIWPSWTNTSGCDVIFRLIDSTGWG